MHTHVETINREARMRARRRTDSKFLEFWSHMSAEFPNFRVETVQ